MALNQARAQHKLDGPASSLHGQNEAAFSYIETWSKRRNPAARVNFLANRKQGLALPPDVHHSVRASVSYRMLRKSCILTGPLVTIHELLYVICHNLHLSCHCVSTMLERRGFLIVKRKKTCVLEAVYKPECSLLP